VYTREGLTPGEWTITVEAWNNHPTTGPTKIGTGTIVVNVVPNTVTSDTVTVLPETGPGALFLKIDWPEGSVPDALVTATLDGAAIGSDQSTTPRFVIDNTTDYSATYDNDTIAGGYHTFAFELFADNGATKVTGDSVSIRIITGYQTSGEWVISELGEVALTIENDFKDPIGIDLPAPTATSSSISATATLVSADIPDPAPTSYDYVWYIDGVEEASNLGSTDTSDTLNITSGLTLSDGNHNLSVVVTAHFSDGIDTISSQTRSFTLP
jgi:hypothetical protein